jgi:arsenite transporter
MLAPTAPIRIGAFKAWLSVWIGIAMVVGLGFGVAAPKAFETLGSFAIAQVNPVTATLVWLMILPTMVQIDYSNLPAIWRSRHSRLGSLVTLSANWIIAPLTMTLLAVLLLKDIFAPWISEADADQYVAGLVLLGVAPCTGMVFVWSRMTGGDPGFTLSQVSVNDLVPCRVRPDCRFPAWCGRRRRAVADLVPFDDSLCHRPVVIGLRPAPSFNAIRPFGARHL